MKQILLSLTCLLGFSQIQATVHTVPVWGGYFQFTNSGFTMQLGDTVEWVPLDQPSMVHTITSSSIPAGAATFDQIWQMPADTFFRYIPTIVGTYDYVCTPHEVSYDMIGNFIVEDSTVGIQTNENLTQVLMYPNPAVEFLQFDSELNGTTYSIFDLNGNHVKIGTLEQMIDVKSLVTGTYYIRFYGDKPRFANFIKQ